MLCHAPKHSNASIMLSPREFLSGRIDEDDLELQEPGESQKTATKLGRMYAMCVSDVGKPTSVERSTVAAGPTRIPTLSPATWLPPFPSAYVVRPGAPLFCFFFFSSFVL